MATSGGLTVLLAFLCGLLGSASVSAASFGQQQHFLHFFRLAEFEENGCLPKRFEQDLPPALWVNAMTCRRQHPVKDAVGHHFSNDSSAEVPSQDEERALYLHCLAQTIGLINETGIAEDRLDAFIDSLPAGKEKTSAWKRNADVCLRHANGSPGQRAVFLFSCLSQKLDKDCARGTNMLCFRAKLLLRDRILYHYSRLDTPSVWRRCAERHAQKNSSVFTDSKRRSPDFCPALLERAVWIASCALRDTGHASGDRLNVTAVWESARQAHNNFDRIIHAGVLRRCQNSSVVSFVRCWAEEMAKTDEGAIQRAYFLSLKLPLSP